MNSMYYVLATNPIGGEKKIVTNNSMSYLATKELKASMEANTNQFNFELLKESHVKESMRCQS